MSLKVTGCNALTELPKGLWFCPQLVAVFAEVVEPFGHGVYTEEVGSGCKLLKMKVVSGARSMN